MKAEGVELRLNGAGAAKPQTFYFRGTQVSDLPEPIKLSISISANCTDDPLFPSFDLPEFTERLHFSFAWNIGGDGDQSRLVVVKPMQRDSTAPPWREGSSSRDFWFTIPAKEIPIESKLSVRVFSAQKLLKTFTLELGRRFLS